MKTSRLEIRLNMKQEGNENDVLQLQRQLQEVVNEICRVDSTIRIFPWMDRETETALENAQVPNEIRSINKYFSRIQPIQTGFAYGEIKITHSRRWEDMIYNMTEWLSTRKQGLYYQTLQCQTTTNLDWLLWSFRRIDIKLLEKKSNKLLALLSNYAIKTLLLE
jgi:hypothetical protein